MYLWSARCFDGHRSVGATLVRIDGDRIASVEPCAADAVPDGTAVYEDATLMPGFVDAHQHLVFDASPAAVEHLIAAGDDELLALMAARAARALSAGITTIRDLGDRNYVSLALRDRAAGEPLPSIIAAGPPITVTQGHCWFMGGEADGVDGVRRAVRDHVARGVDVIKVMVTGGNMTPTVGPHESQYGPAELRAAVDEAHRLGKRVAAHAHGRQGIVDAVYAGVDTIEHCSFMSADGVDDPGDVVEEIVRRDVIVSLTLGRLPDLPLLPAMAVRMDALRANLGRMVAAGVRAVVGTDGGISPAKPHDVLPHAIAQLLEIGMTAEEALVAVTSRAAEACGAGGRKGAIAAGADADVLVLGGDPLTDGSAVHRPVAIYAAGRRAG